MLERWRPTMLFGLLVGGMIFVFATLRILAQTPDPAQSAAVPPPAYEVPVAPALDIPAVAPEPVLGPGRTVTRQGPITLTVQQVEPSYTVAAGDSLSAIAQRTGTTADAIQSINNLPDNFLRVGQRLVLP
jgi:LysM repeat protein